MISRWCERAIRQSRQLVLRLVPARELDNDLVSARPPVLFSLLLLLTCLMIPISATLKSVGMILIVIYVGIMSDYATLSLKWFKSGLGIIIISFLLYLSISVFWSEASWQDGLSGIEKNSKLLYLPVLAAVFSNRFNRWIGLHALLMGVVCVALLSILSYFQCEPFDHFQSDAVFKNHIIMGYMEACGLYLSVYLAAEKRSMPQYCVYLMCTAILAFQLLWINGGRMGYVLTIGLLIVLGWQLRQSGRVVIWIMSLVVVGILLVLSSPVGQARLTQLRHEWSMAKHAPTETSVGYRLQFQALAKKMFLEHPVRGNGMGGYRAYIQNHQLFPNWDGRALREPHNQYALFAAEQGGLGVLLWGGVLGTLMMLFLVFKPYHPLGLAMLLAFCLNQLTDSMFYYSPGFFFIVLMAICLGESYENSV